eukprot:354371-Chlamydomonas_euryale.AAC.3
MFEILHPRRRSGNNSSKRLEGNPKVIVVQAIALASHRYHSFTRNWEHHLGVERPKWCADGALREGASGGCPINPSRRRRGASQGVHTRPGVERCAPRPRPWPPPLSTAVRANSCAFPPGSTRLRQLLRCRPDCDCRRSKCYCQRAS